MARVMIFSIEFSLMRPPDGRLPAKAKQQSSFGSNTFRAQFSASLHILLAFYVVIPATIARTI
jgi:hypothetical protein